MTKPLSAEQAHSVWQHWHLIGKIDAALEAIATGQHQVIDLAESVAVKRRTEKEWREAFDQHYGDDFVERRGTCELAAWLHALRVVGAVIGEKEGG